ncbi:MAG: hypothetical protein WC726_02370 [Parcubacteria group bacterium]|jgi:hypothetical protein
MQEKLKSIIKKFQESQTSLESYQAISEFVEIVIAVPEYIAQVEKEGEIINQEKIKLNADKGWNYGLGGKELDEHNRWRDRKSKALHELDPLFPLQNLHKVHEGIKPENISACSEWLYRSQSPDEPLLKSDKEKYQMFLDKVFKKVLSFLKEEKVGTIEVKNKDTKWESITIRFLNNDDVKIENGKEISETNYEEMGFADGRGSKAILSWDFLHLLSTNEGAFPLGKLSKKDNTARKTQKGVLTKKLKTFFKIKEDPFEEYDRWKKEYRIKLKLVPIPTFRDDFRDRHDKFEGIGEQFAEDTNRK